MTDQGVHEPTRDRTEASVVLDTGDVGHANDTGERVVLASLPSAECECTVRCASGELTTGVWRGVAVTTLLEVCDPPPSTTHLRVVSDDGYRACVGLHDALDALVAVARDDEPLGVTATYDTRFVGPSVPGTRAVKDVARVETLSLAPDEDPRDHETLSLDESTDG